MLSQREPDNSGDDDVEFIWHQRNSSKALRLKICPVWLVWHRRWCWKWWQFSWLSWQWWYWEMLRCRVWNIFGDYSGYCDVKSTWWLNVSNGDYWYHPVSGGEGCYFVPKPTSSTFAEMKRSSGPIKPCWRNNKKEEAQHHQQCNNCGHRLQFKIIFLQLEFLGPDPKSFHTKLSLSVLRKPDIVMGITVMNESWLSLSSSF